MSKMMEDFATKLTESANKIQHKQELFEKTMLHKIHSIAHRDQQEFQKDVTMGLLSAISGCATPHQRPQNSPVHFSHRISPSACVNLGYNEMQRPQALFAAGRPPLFPYQSQRHHTEQQYQHHHQQHQQQQQGKQYEQQQYQPHQQYQLQHMKDQDQQDQHQQQHHPISVTATYGNGVPSSSDI